MIEKQVNKIIDQLSAKKIAELSGASVSSTQQWKQKNESSRKWENAKAIFIIRLLENYEKML